MSNLVWFGLGVGAGVYATVKTRRAVERFTPAGISYQIGAARLGLKVFSAEVREGMVERENQLREQLQHRHNAVETGVAGAPALEPAER